MKPISKHNTSANQRSITAENRIDKIIPILRDCFKHIHVIDCESLKNEVIDSLEDIVAESWMRRTEHKECP